MASEHRIPHTPSIEEWGGVVRAPCSSSQNNNNTPPVPVVVVVVAVAAVVVVVVVVVAPLPVAPLTRHPRFILTCLKHPQRNLNPQGPTPKDT